MTPDERGRAAEGLLSVLEDIKAGRLEATAAQVAYIEGALHALRES